MARTDMVLTPLQGGAGEWSEILAMVLAFAFLTGLSLIILKNKWNRPDLDKEHAAHILSQLDGFGGTGGGAVVVRSPEQLDDLETLRDIRGLFHGERSGEVRVRSATAELIREVRDELRSRAPPVSKVPVRAAQEGVLTALLGALAILPVATWREASETGSGSLPTLPDILSAADLVANGVLGAFTAFPFTDVLFAFGLTFGILGAQTVWTLWWGPPIVLIILSVAYWALERRVETDRDLSGPPVRTWAVRVTSLAVITWAVGTTLAAVGSLIPTIPRIILAVILAVALIAGYVKLSTRPIQPEAMTDGGRGPDDRDDDPFSDMGRPEDSEDAESEFTPTDEFTAVPEDSEDGEHGTFVTDSPKSDPDTSISGTDDTDEPEDSEPGLFGRALGRLRNSNWKHITVLGTIGLGLAHELAAFAAAFTVMCAFLFVWIPRTLRRWDWSAERDGRDAFALDVVHSLTVATAALTLPLMAGYAVFAIGTGKVIRVARAVAVAPDGTVIAVSILGVMVVLTAAVMFLSRFAELRMGIRRGLSVQAVRLALFGKALPLALMIVTAILALALLGTNFVAVIAVTFAVGLIARFGFQVYHTANYRYRTREGRDKTAGRVVVNGRKVTDSDGEPVFIADVNGHRTAHRRVEPLMGQIRADARSLFRTGSADTGSWARYYYKNGVTRGKVDMESVADELLGDIRTRFEANVKKTDANAPDIMDTLNAEYPDHVVQKVVKKLKNKGAVTRREDSYVWLGK